MYLHRALAGQVRLLRLHSNSLSRKFVAADGNTYLWAQKPNAQGDMEWEVYNYNLTISTRYLS